VLKFGGILFIAVACCASGPLKVRLSFRSQNVPPPPPFRCPLVVHGNKMVLCANCIMEQSMSKSDNRTMFLGFSFKEYSHIDVTDFIVSSSVSV